VCRVAAAGPPPPPPRGEAMSRLAARNIAKVLDGKPAETPVE